MAGYCDNHCIHYKDEKCNHPTFPRYKLYLRKDNKRCGGFKGTPGINDRKAYRQQARDKKKAIEQEKLDYALQLIEENGFEKQEGFENFFKLNKYQQYYVFETIVKKREERNVMKEIYAMQEKPIPKAGVGYMVKSYNINPNVIKAVKELANIIVDRTKSEVDLIMHDMIDKVKDAIKEVDVETSLPEDIIQMAKNVADIRAKLSDKGTNIDFGGITFTFGDGSTIADLYKGEDLETIVIDADYEER